MIIDLLALVLLVFAVIKGYQRGLIVGLFSFIAIIVGLAAALKLSAVVANHIGQTVKVSQQWLPVISFIIVFIGIVLLIRLGANMIQKAVEWGMLGWVNRLGGILLYCIIYLLVFSVLLFYADKLDFLQPATRENSITYSYIQPIGPAVINKFGAVIPLFRDMFNELGSFFDGVAQEAR